MFPSSSRQMDEESDTFDKVESGGGSNSSFLVTSKKGKVFLVDLAKAEKTEGLIFSREITLERPKDFGLDSPPTNLISLSLAKDNACLILTK